MSTTIQNSDKKYLSGSGLSYYDGRIKSWANNKFQPIGNYAPIAAMELWEGFLAGLTATNNKPVPTLETIKKYIETDSGGRALELWKGFLDALPTDNKPVPKLADIKSHMQDMIGNGSTGAGRVGALETAIGNLSNAVHFKGVVNKMPDTTACSPGDIIVFIKNNATPEDEITNDAKEFIFDGSQWIELGDTKDYIHKEDIIFITTNEIDSLFN